MAALSHCKDEMRERPLYFGLESAKLMASLRATLMVTIK